jgi:hypothetical protein
MHIHLSACSWLVGTCKCLHGYLGKRWTALPNPINFHHQRRCRSAVSRTLLLQCATESSWQNSTRSASYKAAPSRTHVLMLMSIHPSVGKTIAFHQLFSQSNSVVANTAQRLVIYNLMIINMMKMVRIPRTAVIRLAHLNSMNTFAIVAQIHATHSSFK